MGMGGKLLPVPGWVWRRAVAWTARSVARKVAFMTADDHRVRDFAVTEIVRTGVPVPPAVIAARLAMEPARVDAILDELEARKLFLVRDAAGAVEWVYPVTAAATPHRLRQRSGETLYAA